MKAYKDLVTRRVGPNKEGHQRFALIAWMVTASREHAHSLTAGMNTQTNARQKNNGETTCSLAHTNFTAITVRFLKSPSSEG